MEWSALFIILWQILLIYLLFKLVKLLRKRWRSKRNNIPPFIPPVPENKELVFLDGDIVVTGKNAEINFKPSEKREGTFLVLDTETTGLPIDRDAPSSDVDNWPRVVSISWILFDDERRVIESNYFLVKQVEPIPRDSTSIHGITDEMVKDGGVEPSVAFSALASALNNSRFVIAHNIDFDAPVIEAEFIRLGIKSRIKKKDRICTMRRGTRYMTELLGQKKWPTLDELFYGLFTADIHNSLHNAEMDTIFAAACFFELVEEEYIKIKEPA